MNENLIFIIISFLMVILVTLLVWFLITRKAKKVQRQKGKDNQMHRALGPAAKFARSNGYRFISPANLAKDGRFAHLDAIIIGYFGVLGIKVYGYNGTIYGTANDAQWVQVSDTDEREYFDNPVKQAAIDMRVVRGALFATKQKQVPIEIVSVFTDKKVQIAVPRSVEYLTVKDFKRMLDKDKYREDIGVKLDDAEAAIQNCIVK